MNRSGLNFKKFLTILEKYSVQVENVFVRGNEVIYLNVKYEHINFFILVPENYKMTLNKSIPHININFTEEANSIVSNYTFLLSSKLDSEIILISNNYIFDTQKRSFKISGKKIIHTNIIGIVDLLEKKSSNLLKNISIKFEDTQPVEVPREENFIESELEFLDYDGAVIPKDSNYADMVSDYGDESEPDLEVEEESEWELKDYPLTIGKIFKLVSITDFFQDQGIEKICSDVQNFDNDLYIMERELRKEKFEYVLNLRAKIYKLYQESFLEFEEREEKLTSDKKRLENVMFSLETKTKLDTPEKAEILSKASSEIKNITLKLLKLRNQFNEYYDNYVDLYEKELDKFHTQK